MWNRNKHKLFDAEGNSCFSIIATENHENLNFLIIALGEYAVEMLKMQNKNRQTPLASGIVDGFTPLMLASQYGLAEVIEYLILEGANVNARCQINWTAMHYTIDMSIKQKQQDTILSIVKTLTKSGANIHADTKYSYTPIKLAGQRGLNKVIDYLRS